MPPGLCMQKHMQSSVVGRGSGSAVEWVAGAETESLARSAADVCDYDAGGVAREPFEIVDVGGGDDGAAGQVGDRDREGIDRELGARAGVAEELAGAYAGSGVDRAHLDAIASQAGEHGGV